MSGPTTSTSGELTSPPPHPQDSESENEESQDLSIHEEKEEEEEDGYYASGNLKNILHGIVYQLKLLMFFVQVGLEKYEFDLATEMIAADKFDDVVFRYKDIEDSKPACLYVQVKHRQDETAKITVDDLQNETDKDFSLQKYFISHCNIKNDSRLAGFPVKDCFIFTNIDFDRESGFIVVEEGDAQTQFDPPNICLKLVKPEGCWELQSHSKIPAQYQLHIHSQSMLYDKLVNRSSDAQVLGKKLVEYICNRDTLTRSTEILKTYESALATHVIDVERELFSQSFINDDETLSREVKAFRDIIKTQFLQRTTDRYKSSGADIWNEIKKRDIVLAKQFGNTVEPTLIGVKKFSRQFAEWIKNTSSDELIQLVGNGNDSGYNNIDKLVGHVLVFRNKNIGFRPQFLDKKFVLKSKKLNTFRESLETELNMRKISWEDLKEYRFNITNSRVWKEYYKHCELPEDQSNEREVKTFLKTLVFAVNQVNEEELGKLIKEKIAKDRNLDELWADFVGSAFQEKMLDWFKKKGEKGKEGKFFRKEDGEEFFKSMNDKITTLIVSELSSAYLEELKNYRITFEGENLKLKVFLDTDNLEKPILTFWSNGKTLPTALRVCEAVQKREKYVKDYGLIFMRLSTLLPDRTRKRVMDAFRLSDKYDLLVINCETPDEGFSQSSKQVFAELYEIMKGKKHPKKKCILIIQQSETSFDASMLDSLTYYGD